MTPLAQRLQDYFEQHHGLCLQASEWDAAARHILSLDESFIDMPYNFAEICEALRITKPNLAFYKDESESPINPHGPHSAEAIEWLLESYRDLVATLCSQEIITDKLHEELWAVDAEVLRLRARIQDAEEIWALEAIARRDSVPVYGGHGNGPRITQEQRRKALEAYEQVEKARKLYLEKWER